MKNPQVVEIYKRREIRKDKNTFFVTLGNTEKSFINIKSAKECIDHMNYLGDIKLDPVCLLYYNESEERDQLACGYIYDINIENYPIITIKVIDPDNYKHTYDLDLMDDVIFNEDLFEEYEKVTAQIEELETKLHSIKQTLYKEQEDRINAAK